MEGTDDSMCLDPLSVQVPGAYSASVRPVVPLRKGRIQSIQSPAVAPQLPGGLTQNQIVLFRGSVDPDTTKSEEYGRDRSLSLLSLSHSCTPDLPQNIKRTRKSISSAMGAMGIQSSSFRDGRNGTKKVQLIEQAALATSRQLAEKDAIIERLKQERGNTMSAISKLNDELRIIEREKEELLGKYQSTTEGLARQVEEATTERITQNSRIECLESTIYQLQALIENEETEKRRYLETAQHTQSLNASRFMESRMEEDRHHHREQTTKDAAQQCLDDGDIQMAEGRGSEGVNEGGVRHLHTYGKQKGKSIEVTMASTAEMSDEDESNRRVPPLVRYGWSSGGAGPRWRFRNDTESGVRGSSGGRSGGSDPGGSEGSGRMDGMGASGSGKANGESILQALLDEMRGLREEFSQGSHKQSRPLMASSRFKNPPRRRYDPERTNLLAVVRPVMNLMLGIECDNDYKKVKTPDENQVLQYNEGTGAGPNGLPISPYFIKVDCPWNKMLADNFICQFRQQHQDFCETQEDEDVVYELFFQHLFRLRRRFRTDKPRLGEDEEDSIERVRRSCIRRKEMQRPCTRRNNLFKLRTRITEGNRKRTDNTVDPFWDFLYHMVIKLGTNGMSSDEEDGNRSNGFWVKKCAWRSSALSNYLSVIDNDHNFTTAYSEAHPGNLPRVRKRRVGATLSVRDAVPGLPRNFYDDAWYDSLSNRDKRWLDAGDAIELPEVVPN